MKRLLFLLSLILTLAMSSTHASAQNIVSKTFSSLEFETPNTLWRPKAKSANYRSQPNVKAPKVVIGYNEALDMGEFVNDIGNNLAWVTAKRGGKTVYLSKSVMKKVSSNLISPSVYNIPFYQEYRSYDEANIGWRVGKMMGDNDLYLAEVMLGYDEFLMLGKMINNILVFKYRVKINNPIYGSNDFQPAGKYFLETDVDDQGVKTYYFKPNKSMVIDNNKLYTDADSYDQYSLDLTKIPETVVYSFFKEVIKKNEVDYFYLTSESFTEDLPHSPC